MIGSGLGSSEVSFIENGLRLSHTCMSTDFQTSIRFVLKLASLPWADVGKEVVPKRQPHRCCRCRVTRGHACSARGGGGGTLRVTGLLGRRTDWKAEGPQEGWLWSVFLPSNAMHTPHLTAISSLQKDSSCLNSR